MSLRAETVRRVLLLEGVANAMVLAAKLSVGLATGSAAVLGDAVHSLTDVVNNVVAFAVAGSSSAPPDRDHPYGHRKFESLAVFGLALLLAVVALEVAMRAVGRAGAEVVGSSWGLAVMVGVLVINLALAGWEGYWARRVDSDLLRADARHTLGDVFTTLAVIGGWQLAARGYVWLDRVVALLIAGLVFYLAYDLFRRVVPVLVDRAGADPGAVVRTVSAVGAVRDVRRVRSRATATGVVADVVVTVDGELSTAASHEVASAIEDLLREKLGIDDVTVHVEPG